MSLNVNWDVEKYREEHETDEHWELRKAFMERWKDNYPEDRLVCLARVFSNIELMGCRYPPEVMKEVATLSKEVAHSYRLNKKSRLQRTFVSASDAAEDRARGVKREGGIIKEAPAPKSNRIDLKINFVKQGETVKEVDLTEEDSDKDADPNEVEIESNTPCNNDKSNTTDKKESIDSTEYLNELERLHCIDVRRFRENMFNTLYGRFVLLIRPWTSKLGNIQASCDACRVQIQSKYENNTFQVIINGRILAEGRGETKQVARSVTEALAWDRIKTQVISVFVKEQFIAHGDRHIAVGEVSGQRPKDDFGTPIESSVASKMMKMMGWKGGGLGAEAQGIAEPIKPHLQMVNRAGLGSISSDIKTLRRLGANLMQRYIASSSLDVDLVFSCDFSKEERAALHQVAQKQGLASKSYGSDADRYNFLLLVPIKGHQPELIFIQTVRRFLVVKKKLNPFAIVKAALEEGGNTAKYQVFIPVALSQNTSMPW